MKARPPKFRLRERLGSTVYSGKAGADSLQNSDRSALDRHILLDVDTCELNVFEHLLLGLVEYLKSASCTFEFQSKYSERMEPLSNFRTKGKEKVGQSKKDSPTVLSPSDSWRCASISSEGSPSTSGPSQKNFEQQNELSWAGTSELTEIQPASLDRQSFESDCTYFGAARSSRAATSLARSSNQLSPIGNSFNSARSRDGDDLSKDYSLPTSVSGKPSVKSWNSRWQKSSWSSPDSVLDVNEHNPEFRELENAFRIIDTDNDGKISESELGAVLRLLGADFSDEETRLLMRAVDTDGDGQIDLREFIHHNTLPAQKAKSTATRTRELRAAFQLFDIERENHISARGLYRVLKGLGERTTMEKCNQMIRGVDCDGDGKVSFEEFERMMT